MDYWSSSSVKWDRPTMGKWESSISQIKSNNKNTLNTMRLSLRHLTVNVWQFEILWHLLTAHTQHTSFVQRNSSVTFIMECTSRQLVVQMIRFSSSILRLSMTNSVKSIRHSSTEIEPQPTKKPASQGKCTNGGYVYVLLVPQAFKIFQQNQT